MSRPYNPERREREIATVARFAFHRVVTNGETPRAAVDAVADRDDSGLVEFGPGDREDAVAHVEEATVGLLERVAARLEDLDVDPDRWGCYDCPDCGSTCHVDWSACSSCDRPLPMDVDAEEGSR